MANIEAPEILVNSQRVHDRLVKRVMLVEAEQHWKNRIPGHFIRTAHRKYGYENRNRKYQLYKLHRYGGQAVDLVKTGRTQHAMTNLAQISVRNSTTQGVQSTIRLRFPFYTGSKRRFRSQSEKGVRLEQMMSEIQRITTQEEREIADSIAANYVVLVDTDTSRRQRGVRAPAWREVSP